jgi:hypothetical protein
MQDGLFMRLVETAHIGPAFLNKRKILKVVWQSIFP